MPDHLHLLVEPTTPDADVLRFVTMFKQRTAFQHRRQGGPGLWQESFYDRVIRSEETTLSVAKYIWANPVREGLVARAEDWPYNGSDTFNINDVCRAEL